jgi:hypothetical protein
MKKIVYSLFAILIIEISACKTGLKPMEVDNGTANFSRYVAIGNSLTAGFTDGALSLRGQKNAYPVMLAEKMQLAGGGDFKVPYMLQGAGNNGLNRSQLILGYVIPCNSNIYTYGPLPSKDSATLLHDVSAEGPYNLIGVPAARSVDAVAGVYSVLNPFLRRMCASPGTSTMLSEALRVNPTFFTLWLGNNDVLLYALNGAIPPVDIFSPTLVDSTQTRMAIG